MPLQCARSSEEEEVIKVESFEDELRWQLSQRSLSKRQPSSVEIYQNYDVDSLIHPPVPTTNKIYHLDTFEDEILAYQQQDPEQATPLARSSSKKRMEPKRKLLLVGGGLLLLLAIVAVVGGVVGYALAPSHSHVRNENLSVPSVAPTTSASGMGGMLATPGPTTTPTASPTDEEDRSLKLLRSVPGELMILVNSQGLFAARSYDARDWEPVPPILESIVCDPIADCQIKEPKDTNYTITSRRITQTKTKEQTQARLLMQATFGPTFESIQQARDLTAEQWILRQIKDVPPTLHRVHVRQRSNQALRQESDFFGTRDPCSLGSRWNRYAFSKLDLGKTLTVSFAGSLVLLSIDGIPRTEVAKIPFSFPTQNVICEVGESVNGLVRIGKINPTSAVADCDRETQLSITPNGPTITVPNPDVLIILNPPIQFTTTSGTGDIPVGVLEDLSPHVADTKLLKIPPGQCSLSATNPIFLRDFVTGQLYRGDRRLELVNNDFSQQQQHNRGPRTRTCPTAPKSFLNEQTCVIRSGCSPPVYTNRNFRLTDSSIRAFYEMEGMYVYRISGLQTKNIDWALPSICSSRKITHRWIRRDPSTENADGSCAVETIENNDIKDVMASAIFNALLTTSLDRRVIDIPRNTYTCTDLFSAERGVSITVADMGCWTHSHPDEWNVYDFSRWMMIHPGNEVAFEKHKPHPIAKHAERLATAPETLQVATTINFPSWKTMDKWEAGKNHLILLGVYDEFVNFATLDPRVQGPNVAKVLRSQLAGEMNPKLEICGSPGEVANDPSLGHQYLNFREGDQGKINTDSFDQDHAVTRQKQILWGTVAFSAPDQLRQRVAWALAQIFVVTEHDIDRSDEIEVWATYYDIFVRNAFGSFQQLLKEVSFSPMMGGMLTYIQSSSYAYNVEKGEMLFPDENFAREILQLFTIGLWRLNPDGTRKLDPEGMPIPTYDNRDIMTTARGWTGFDEEASRSNYEAENLDQYAGNRIDPMRMVTRDTRDVFPKLWLDDNGRKYVGDGLQLCESIPEKAFLKKGAKYRYLGTSSLSELGRADAIDANMPERKLILNEQSQLYAKLCNLDSRTGLCQFKSSVELDANLNCNGICSPSETAHASGAFCECTVDEARVVRLDGPKTGSPVPIYYEYVRQPCVRLGFPERGSSMTAKELDLNGGAMCGDVNLAEAGTVCCAVSSVGSADLMNAKTVCAFQEERVTFKTAEQYCLQIGRVVCPWAYTPENYDCSNMGDFDTTHWRSGMRFLWTNSPCSVKAQINSIGEVAIVHNVEPLPNPVKLRVAEGTGTFFHVLWDDGFPKADNCGANCVVSQIDPTSCLCDAHVSTVPAFVTLPSISQILSELHIGAPNPTLLDPPRTGNQEAGGYTVYYGPSGVLDMDTIFEVEGVGGKSKFLLNIKSTVVVGGKGFRNPPMMNSAIDDTRRDAYYEIDEMLEHYVHHSTVAPFIATRLIQFLITSNPSPGYVSAVANAFKTGRHSTSSGVVGTGNYGDLAATIASIFLHPEARSEVLDEDPSFGRMREPVDQVMHFLRAMELGTSNGYKREVRLTGLSAIEQEPHNAPSVFGYFSPDFQPPGPVYDASLYSPESQLLQAPQIAAFMNGLASVVNYGLNDCKEGLGDSYERYEEVDQPSDKFECLEADLSNPSVEVPYRLRWTPSAWNKPLSGSITVRDTFATEAEEVVEEMNLLLLAGRLTNHSRSVIKNAYMDRAANEGNVQEGRKAGLRVAQQLFTNTPEFFITNNLRDHASSTNPQTRPQERPAPPGTTTPVTGYKAMVYIFLAGGCDSYSALVPFGGCGTTDLPGQYKAVRSDVALDPSELLPVRDKSNTQPCTTFGLHPSLSNLASLYENGEAAVVANVGPLVVPLNNVEYESSTKLFPMSLFAHNSQTDITQTVAPLDSRANGILGKVGDALNAQSCTQNSEEGCEIFSAYSIKGTPKILEGAPGVSRAADVLTGDGVRSLSSEILSIQSTISDLNKISATSIYGETRAASVMNTLGRLTLLDGVLTNVSLTQSCWDSGISSIKSQMKTVATIMLKRDELEAKRDVFYVSQGGYDTHSDNGPKVTKLLADLDDAVGCFHLEMVGQGIWSNVTLMTASEFGRTLSSNGLGTDHGWGGNHFVMGGDVNGGRIFGQYPSDITDTGKLRLSRGRLIPGISWDSVWNSVALWLGVEETRIAQILPNLDKFLPDGMGRTLFR